MEPTDRSAEGEETAEDKAISRPWGPQLPAPGAPVAAFDVDRDETETLKASTATALYEAARFTDPEELVPAAAGRSTVGGAGSQDDGDAERSGLRILGVPAPKEIAGPVLAGLALAAALYGWRRRRRRRRG